MVRLPPPIPRDAIIPGAIALLGALELAALQPEGWGLGVVAECIACLLLVWRRTHTLVVCTAAALVLVAIPWFGPALDEPSTPIVIIAVVAYSLARYIPDLGGIAGLGVVVVGLAIDYGTLDPRVHNVSDVVFVAALITPPYVLGRLTRKLAEQRAQLVRQQELVKREAVRAERDRIARELHDVIAHSVSAMVVQTAAAQDLLHTDPERASEVLEDVATTGRRALAETGRLLHVIRDDANELGLEPAPSLARLPELVEGFRGSGLTVDVKLDGPITPLPEGVDLSAYRIVQEALTNALKYSADSTTSLRLIRTPRQLTIQAENAARHGDIRGNGGGLGLVGMAERVSVFGGSLSHGLNGNGRYVLTATLPVAGGGEHA